MLLIEGQDTEVDKGLVDVLAEPILHIIRNAIDHGIETPEERRMANKGPSGTIRLEAYHEGNDIVIEVEDDGRGIDILKIKEKVREKGLVPTEELEGMDERAIIDLIFLSGLSTADRVSEVSGRGIGMDVVRGVVKDLRGSIQVRSGVGKGTTFSLRFPLTLAIIRAILFKIEGRTFAIPLESIQEITRLFSDSIETISGREVFRLRDKVIPLVRLNEVVSPHPPYTYLLPQLPEVFANRLDSISRIDVKEAKDGDTILPGRVLIAPGGRHMRVKRMNLGSIVILSGSPPLNGHRPSVDLLFSSVATEYGRDALGLLMTGMGDDGVEGLGDIKRAGGMTIAQDEASSIVFGMPKVAIERGYAQRVVPLEDMATTIVDTVCGDGGEGGIWRVGLKGLPGSLLWMIPSLQGRIWRRW